MKKVLIALDFDPVAQKIAESGYALAKSMNAKVVLLHVVSDAAYYSSLNYSPMMGFDSFESFKGTMSQQNISDPTAYERANYIKILEGVK